MSSQHIAADIAESTAPPHDQSMCWGDVFSEKETLPYKARAVATKTNKRGVFAVVILLLVMGIFIHQFQKKNPQEKVQTTVEKKK